GNFDNGQYLNPYADLMKGYKDYSNSLMMAQFELKQDFGFLLKGLKLRGMFSTDRYSSFDVRRFYNPFYYTVGGYDRATGVYLLQGLNPETGTEFLNYSEGQKEVISSTYMESAINYDREIGPDHTVGALMVLYMRNKLV